MQDHLGDVLAKRGRLPDAIEAWTRALEGDGCDVDLAEIQKKINDARSKIRKSVAHARLAPDPDRGVGASSSLRQRACGPAPPRPAH